MAILLLIALAAIPVFGALLFSGTAKHAIGSYFVMLAFGSCALVFGWSVFRTGSITLDANGLTWRTGVRTFRRSWDDYSEFIPYPKPFGSQPGCIFSANYQAKHPFTAAVGGFGCFGGFWELPTKEMVALLNSARNRWSAFPQ